MCTMIKMPLNVRGLGNLLKKQSLHSLLELHKLDTRSLHETKGDGKKCVSELTNILKDWDFFYLDYVGCSGGLISVRRNTSLCTNFFKPLIWF